MRRLRLSPAVVAALAVTLSAGAEPEAVQVRYSSPAGCSSRDAFVQELARRTARARVVGAGTPGPTFVIELADRSTGVVGQLRWLEPDGTETVRSVSGASCEEVVSALALIAAVLVDPDSLTRSPISPASPAPAPPTPARAEREELEWRPSFGAGGTLRSALAPGWSYGPFFELGLELERGGRRGPAATVALERVATSTTATPAGDADFSSTLGRIALCPLRWPATGPWFGTPCGAFEAGSLHAAGSRTLDKREVSTLWLAIDPALSLSFRPLAELSIDLDLSGVFPLVDDKFLFGPSTPIFSIPFAGFSARLGARAVWR